MPLHTSNRYFVLFGFYGYLWFKLTLLVRGRDSIAVSVLAKQGVCGENEAIIDEVVDNSSDCDTENSDEQIVDATRHEEHENDLIECDDAKFANIELEQLQPDVPASVIPVEPAIEHKTGFDAGNGLKQVRD